MKNSKFDKEFFKRRFSEMETDAQSWKSAWTDLRNFIRPTKGMFLGDQPNDGSKIDHQTLLTGTSVLAARTLASGMTSGLTSPSRPWFELLTDNQELNEKKPVRVWLTNVRDIMMAAFRKSNFYESVYSVYDETGSFGTGAVLEKEDDKDDIRFIVYTIGEYFLSFDSDGRVNGFGRRYWKTVEQIVDEFKIENVSDQIKLSYKDKRYGDRHKINHLVTKNKNREYGKIDNQNMEYVSLYWEEGVAGEEYLKISGYQEFPLMAPRWETKNTSSSYGTGPGWDALGDIKMLQKEVFSLLLATDKVLDPPVQVDASVQGEANMEPGGITRFSGTLPNAGVKAAYEIKPDIQAGQMMLMETKNDIKQYFYYDLFLMLASSDKITRTAREIEELHGEKLLSLGPVLGRLENELLDPIIDRTFNILVRKGKIPPPPPELQGRILKVEYISILAQAQKMVGARPIEQLINFVSAVVGLAPEAVDVLNADEIIYRYGETIGAHPKMLRDALEIKLLRTQRQRAQQNQAMAEQMAAATEGAKTLSETKLGQNNALDRMLEMAQG